MILDFFWLSSEYRLTDAFHWAKDILVQSIPDSLDRRKMYMIFNPNLELLLGLKDKNLLLLFYRYLLPAFSTIWISIQIDNTDISETFMSFHKM